MREGWTLRHIGEVAVQRVTPVALKDGAAYSSLGVKWYAGGTFKREPKSGRDIKAKRLFRVVPGQFVYNRMFATEGSFALIRPEDADAVASNEFPVFDLDQSSLLPDYLLLHFQQPSVWQQVSTECVGTTKSRLRWKEPLFLAHSLPLPPVDGQRRIVDLIQALDGTLAAAEDVRHRVDAALDISRDEELWAVDERCALSELCSIEGKLVAPTGKNASLPHVGTERIVSGTGELVGVRTAGADGVTSGKHPFSAAHVIYSKIRPNLRKVAVPDFDGLTSADAYPLLPVAGVPRRYLQQLLLSGPFTDLAVARSGRTKMPKINRAELMTLQVPKRGAEDMSAMGERLDALVGVSAAAQREVERLRDLRSNLLTALLSGAHEIPGDYDELLAG